MSTFKPVITTSNYLPTIGIVNGQLIVVTDTKDIYVDSDNTRSKYTDVITGTYNNIVNLLAPLQDKIYFATDTNQLLQYTGSEWVNLGQAQSIIVNNSDAAVSITLADNTIYNLTNSNITSITLTVSSGLSYCTLCFTAGTSTSFAPPVGARCIGHDCYGGVFTPLAGREYQIAIDVLNNITTFYVLSINLNTGLIPTDSEFSIDSTNPVGNNVVTAAVNTLNNNVTTLSNTKADISTVISNDNASVLLTLSNNTIYRCTNTAINDLTIAGVDTGFVYATITFTSRATLPTTFAVPSTGYYCSGAECANGAFTPVAGMRYNLAVENEGDRIAIYVMEAL